MVKLNRAFEMGDRTCEALLLGFLPNHSLYSSHGRGFYIPSVSHIYSLVVKGIAKLTGKKYSLPEKDRINWDEIGPSELNENVLEGLKIITTSQQDSLSPLELYLFPTRNPLFQHRSVEGLGDVYRYREGQRKKAFGRVYNFWNKEELDCFRELHKSMRHENKKIFENNAQR